MNTASRKPITSAPAMNRTPNSRMCQPEATKRSVANRRWNCCRPTKSNTGSIFELLKARRTVQTIAPI